MCLQSVIIYQILANLLNLALLYNRNTVQIYNSDFFYIQDGTYFD